MKSLIFSIALALPLVGFAQAVPGKPAPAFEIKDASGQIRKLSDYKGKWVVLEWFNKDCPYVKKHYGAGNMQKLQKTYTDKGATWLTVISSAQGKQGYMEPSAALAEFQKTKAANSSVLLDPKGEMGKAYGAKTTPHMFVINPEGNIVYAGAIDNNDSADPGVIPKSKNFVQEALDLGMAGKPVVTATAKPYGCSIKYQ